jgi:hypothetical protein
MNFSGNKKYCCCASHQATLFLTAWNVRISYLMKYHAIKTYGGVEVYIHVFLTPALDESG